MKHIVKHFVPFRWVGLGVVGVLGWVVALSAAAATRSVVVESETSLGRFALLAALAGGAQMLGEGLQSRLYGTLRIGSMDDVVAVVRNWLPSSLLALLANAFLEPSTPFMVLLVSMPLALVVMLGVRLVWRLQQDRWHRPSMGARSRRVLVFGAGEGGDQIIRSMLRDPDSHYIPVGALDDDPSKASRRILGVRVMGNRSDLRSVAARTAADVLLIAIPSAQAELIADLDEAGQDAGLDVRVLPSANELVGLLSTNDIRELSEADFLGRDEVKVDMQSIRSYVSGKRVMVTGAGGSIGSELCRQLARFDCESLIMLDRDESGLHATQLAIEGRALLDSRSLVVADIRDRDRVFDVFEEHRPHVVFHTAALKHLTLLEMHPEEGRKTNVEGSRNLLDAAESVGVDCYVNVSTDKAADPTSVLGRTKLEAEKLTASKAVAAAGKYVSVRFGNVLGSRGSVLPIFRHQIAKGGPITVTHRDVTRYFMTIPEAVALVLQAGAIGRDGEVMILDMGEPVKIVDLAEQMIRHYGVNVGIEFTGLRPGEKMHEILISRSEVAETREHSRILHALPEDLGVAVPANGAS